MHRRWRGDVELAEWAREPRDGRETKALQLHLVSLLDGQIAPMIPVMGASASFTFRAKTDLSDAIRQGAVAHGLPVSAVIRRAIRSGLLRNAQSSLAPRTGASAAPDEAEADAGHD